MKKPLFCCLFIFSFSFLNAQTSFEYDDSGHRTSMLRTIVMSAPSQAPVHMPPTEENTVYALALNNEEEAPVFGSSEINSFSEDVYTDKLKESDIFIYPNPTKGALAVEIRNKNPQASHQVTVYTMSGAVIFQQSQVGDYTPIDLSSQPRGVYLLRISSQNSFITWKIIKE